MRNLIRDLLIFCLVFCSLALIYVSFTEPLSVGWSGYKIYTWGTVAPAGCEQADACGGEVDYSGYVWAVVLLLVDWVIFLGLYFIPNTAHFFWKTPIYILFAFKALVASAFILAYVIDGNDYMQKTLVGGYIVTALNTAIFSINLIAIKAKSIKD